MKEKTGGTTTANPPRQQNSNVPVEETRRHARELRNQGRTLSEIADQLGSSSSVILFHLLPEMNRSPDNVGERVASIREHDFEITQLLLEVVMPNVLKDQQEAFKQAMSLLERRSKYWGLDISTKSSAEPATNSTTPFGSIETMIAAIAKRTNLPIDTLLTTEGDKHNSF